MKAIRSIDAWYPAFPIGQYGPEARACKLSLVECNGKCYLKTPFAFLDATGADAPERQMGRGYYGTEAECLDYLAREYPAWKLAAPIMEALTDAIQLHGPIVGPGQLADRVGIAVDQVYKIARGHKSVKPRAIKAALAALKGARAY